MADQTMALLVATITTVPMGTMGMAMIPEAMATQTGLTGEQVCVYLTYTLFSPDKCSFPDARYGPGPPAYGHYYPARDYRG
jgi:hypothetical protein